MEPAIIAIRIAALMTLPDLVLVRGWAEAGTQG